MTKWLSLLQKPNNSGERKSVEIWFDRIAFQLLNNSHLVVGNELHRLVEIEFYYFGDAHPDPFTHCDRLQLECGRWYFHRSRGSYRGGSFKGLDLTFGDGKAFGGILIRTIEKPDKTLINGCSLCVDYLIAKAGLNDVASFDRAIGDRVAWDTDSPLFIEEVCPTEVPQIFRSARVGLSLAKSKTPYEKTRYIVLPYRYLTEPRRISKGKPYLVLGLYIQGNDLAIIHQLTGCPKQTIERYIAEYKIGRQETDFSPYFGSEPDIVELCRLHGVWYANTMKNV